MKPYDDPIVIVEPDHEPVTVAEAKLSTKAAYGTAEDDLFQDIWIPGARRHLEKMTGRTFYQKTLEWSLDYWSNYPAWDDSGFYRGTCAQGIELPRATPLIDVISVKYTDSSGNENTVDPSTYVVDTSSMPGRVVLGYSKSWPPFTPASANAVKIQYTAGTPYVYPTSLDADIRLGVLLLVGTIYANRESEIPVDNLAKQLLKLPLFGNIVQSLRVVHEFSDQ